MLWRGRLRGDPEMPVVKEDCDWIVGRYRSHLLHNDRSAAKAWILTARSLFPDNFEVQVPSLLVRINWNKPLPPLFYPTV